MSNTLLLWLNNMISEYDYLIGQVLTEEIQQQLRNANQPFRIKHPNGVYTQDYRPDRLNIRVDTWETKNIIDVYWG